MIRGERKVQRMLGQAEDLVSGARGRVEDRGKEMGGVDASVLDPGEIESISERRLRMGRSPSIEVEEIWGGRARDVEC